MKRLVLLLALGTFAFSTTGFKANSPENLQNGKKMQSNLNFVAARINCTKAAIGTYAVYRAADANKKDAKTAAHDTYKNCVGKLGGTPNSGGWARISKYLDNLKE